MATGQDDKTVTEVACIERPTSVEAIQEAGYFAANPEVRGMGVSAQFHFATAGRREGRLQWINMDEVAAMREEKLSRLRFRRPPEGQREYGQAANFLTPRLIAEFGIPETPPISANLYGGPFIDEMLSDGRRLCLDVGAGLRHSCFSNVVNTEIYNSASTDVICVGEDLPFEDNQFDYVICAAVLEHTRRPWDVAEEIIRVLTPGGKVLVDYPFLQGVHGYPHHYFNATPQGAISLFEGGCEILSSTIEPNNHPINSIWWLLASWRHGLDGADRQQFENITIGELLATPLDQLQNAGFCRNLREDIRQIIPAGSTLIARKKR